VHFEVPEVPIKEGGGKKSLKKKGQEQKKMPKKDEGGKSSTPEKMQANPKISHFLPRTAFFLAT